MLRYLKQLKARQRAVLGPVLVFVGLIVPLLSFAGFTPAWTINFEDLELGELNDQGNFSGEAGYWSVVDTQVKAGAKGGKGTGSTITFNPDDVVVGDNNEIYNLYFRGENAIVGDYIYADFQGDIGDLRIRLFRGETDYILTFRDNIDFIDCDTWEHLGYASQQILVADLPTDDAWLEVKITIIKDVQAFKVGWSRSGIEYTEHDFCFWFQSARSNTTLEEIIFVANATHYFDEFGKEKGAGKVFGVAPDSGTEITSADTNFTFGWQDLDDWDTLSVVFQNRATGIYTDAKEYQIETIGASGEKTLSFENFNFDRNGKFYFYAVATRTVLEVIEGMYLTGRYSYEWSDDLVDPEYWFAINIEGFTPIFGMSDFEEWYAVESKFAEPTDLFFAIAGFFQPTFNKIGEFGNRIKDYFDLDEVYSQGYEIGKYISYFAYFVDQISLFLGGFPLLKWVFVVILLLTGIFIFRLVLKFIPFLGGS